MYSFFSNFYSKFTDASSKSNISIASLPNLYTKW